MSGESLVVASALTGAIGMSMNVALFHAFI